MEGQYKMRNHLNLIQDLVKCTTHMDIHLVGGTDEMIEKLMYDDLYGVIWDAAKDRFFANTLRAIRPGRVYEIRDFLNVCLCVIYDGDSHKYLVMGPCVTDRLSRADAQALMKEKGLPQPLIRRVTAFCEKLPDVPAETLQMLGTLLVQHLQQIPHPVPYQTVAYRWDADYRQKIELVDHYEDLARMRQIETRYELSAAFTEAVKAGNLSMAYQFMDRMNSETGTMVRNPDPLRNAQNMCIVLNTQLRYAMEECGIHPYRLDSFSNEIALHIEQLRNQKEASRFPVEIIRRYCELAQEHRFPNLKPFSHLAVAYIKAHLSDNLTVKATADALNVNANYLSYQFHQEVGMRFTDFVNRERTYQAAALLKHTNLQIQQIAAAVGYNNTSYFSKQFVRFQQMTPRAYRNSGLL